MKALILVGGYGTRLRPMTLSCPKPLVPFLNEPMIIHQIRALKKVGVNEVVLAVNYQPQIMMEKMNEYAAQLDIKITYSVEKEPMGTAGPIALAKEILNDGDPFFVLNSDIISVFPFEELLAFHKKNNAEGTIMVTQVEDPTKYGVVVSDSEGRISRFVEKPKDFISDRINAGIYCLSPAVFKRIQLRPTSIEREIFPALAKDGQIFALDLPGFWMDIGQPKDFLTGQGIMLDWWSHEEAHRSSLATGPHITGTVFIASSAVVSPTALLGPNVVVGPNVVIEDGARLKNCVIFEGSKIRAHSFISESIVGWHCTVGRWSQLRFVTCLGEDVNVHDEVFVNGAKVLPHKDIGSDVMEANKIIM